MHPRIPLFKNSCRRFATRPKPEHSRKDLPDFDPSPSFRLTMPPNPKWEPGQGASELDKAWTHDVHGVTTWNPVLMPSRRVYSLLTSAVVPRPIALLSTISTNGRPNLSLSSYFSLVAHNPPLLSISLPVTLKKPEETRGNIMATKEFTVSLVSEPFVEAANVISTDAPEHVDMWALSGLTMARSSDVRPAWVKESGVGFECKFYHALDIPEPETGTVTQTMMLGLIKRIHVRRSVLGEDGTIDPARLRAVSRIGGSTYARIGQGFDLRRPNWSGVKEGYRMRRRGDRGVEEDE
ncbi:hypothetical protein OG21DRAFT_1406083 [Imleria badia]|nr:hypothetical protein OG21DRAFT_1406083 [Imleria badia]